MKLTKQKLLEIIEQELKEQSQFPGLSEPFIKALQMVQRTQPNQPYFIPKGVDDDTIKTLFTLKQNNQLNNVKVLQFLDKRTRNIPQDQPTQDPTPPKKRTRHNLETPEWI